MADQSRSHTFNRLLAQRLVVIMVKTGAYLITMLCCQILLFCTQASCSDMVKERARQSDAQDTPGLIDENGSFVAFRSIKQLPEDTRIRFLPLLNAAADRSHFNLLIEGEVEAKFQLYGEIDSTAPGKIFYVWSVYNQKRDLIAKRSVRLRVERGTLNGLSDEDLTGMANAAIAAITSSVQLLPAARGADGPGAKAAGTSARD